MYPNTYYRYPTRQNLYEPKYITVDGVYVHELSPDTFLITASITSFGDTSFEAVTNTNHLYNQTVKEIMDFGIKEDDIIPENSSVTPIFKDDNVIASYKATTTFTVRVFEFETVLEALSSPGDLYFEGITFTLTNPVRHYHQALRKAVDDGITKAKEIAETIGVSIDPIPLTVKEITNLSQLIEKITISFPGDISTMDAGYVYVEAMVQETFKIYTPS